VGPVQRLFTLEEARAELPRVLADADEVIRLRVELVESTVVPDQKGLEARLSEILDGLVAAGIQVKGYAPLLLDFPSMMDGREVLLCWLEGETELAWYHDAGHGFMGRRRLP
jgi:hypothetical protein